MRDFIFLRLGGLIESDENKPVNDFESKSVFGSVKNKALFQVALVNREKLDERIFAFEHYYSANKRLTIFTNLRQIIFFQYLNRVSGMPY
jgi:hypothetical protein